MTAVMCAVNPEDRRPVEFSVDPEDRNLRDLLHVCDECLGHDYFDPGRNDYFLYGSKTSSSTTPTPNVNDYFVHVPDVD